MYPFGDLPGNLTAFCAALRREHGFGIGPGEIADATRVLRVIDLADQQHVRHAWRAILSNSRDTAARFDAAFDAFFFPGPAGTPQTQQPPLSGGKEQPGTAGDTSGRRPPGGDPSADVDPEIELEGTRSAPAVLAEDSGTDGEPAGRWARSNYSPLAVEGQEPILLRPVPTPWRDAARLLLRRLQLGLSRRWEPARRGRRFDLRRTWRASLQTGGEAVTARWLRRAHRSPNLVLLIDGSRSMSAAQQAGLDLATAVATVTRRVEVFAFSTSLTVLTHHVRRAGAGRRMRIAISRESWGGGTSIGASLRSFLRRHGERHVGAETLILIVSDGLDVGEPQILRDAMRELYRRAAGVVWINPLLDTPGYEPTSRGMAAARPFITTFISVHDSAGLARLARMVRVRR
jgi:uncharacterized protein with von Willebrand factor type A (vWA) domain